MPWWLTIPIALAGIVAAIPLSIRLTRLPGGRRTRTAKHRKR